MDKPGFCDDNKAVLPGEWPSPAGYGLIKERKTDRAADGLAVASGRTRTAPSMADLNQHQPLLVI